MLTSSNESLASLDYESGSDSGNDVSTRLNSKQQLAMTIRNWTTMPENDKSVINEGGVLTLIKLASIDDIIVKKCCASAFFHLSSREQNRHDLVQLGAVAGVIAISTQVRSWNIAKLCAMCLCNLSIEPEGESIMAKEGSFCSSHRFLSMIINIMTLKPFVVPFEGYYVMYRFLSISLFV